MSHIQTCRAEERCEQVPHKKVQGDEDEVGEDKENIRHSSFLPSSQLDSEEYEERKSCSTDSLKILVNCILHFSHHLWYTFFTHSINIIIPSLISSFLGKLSIKDRIMARYRSTMAIDTSKSDFNDFYEIASHPRTLLQPQLSVESKDGKKRRPFSSFFSNGLHVPQPSSVPSSAGPIMGTSNNFLHTPVTIREPSSAPILESSNQGQSSYSDPNKKFVRRGSFILSSGRDKFTYDSDAMPTTTTINARDKKLTQTRPNLNQESQYHNSRNNINDNNNSASYLNYNDLSVTIPSYSPSVRAPMIAKRTSSQLSSTTSGSDGTTSSARSDVDDLNENMSVHSLHPFSFGGGSSPSHSYHNNHNTSSSHQYQHQTSTSSSSHHISTTATPFHPYTSNHGQTSPSSPTPSICGKSSLNHPTPRMKRTSVVRSAHLMENPSRPVQSNGRFGNPWDTWAPLRFTNILKWGLAKDKSNIPSKEVSHFIHSFYALLF